MAIINKNQLKVNHISGFKLKKVIGNGIINIDNKINNVQFSEPVIALIIVVVSIPIVLFWLSWVASYGVKA